MLSEIYWSFFTTSVITCLLGMIKMMYKSKCSSVDICCMKIVRDVSIEQNEDIEEMRAKGKTDEEVKV